MSDRSAKWLRTTTEGFSMALIAMLVLAAFWPDRITRSGTDIDYSTTATIAKSQRAHSHK
ncbi:MAG: hypothetical protein KGM42_11195 [Hyphomicrobiales bacterium]|nr:hypothetical protein [Hyphomicrobiales bacterium]